MLIVFGYKVSLDLENRLNWNKQIGKYDNDCVDIQEFMIFYSYSAHRKMPSNIKGLKQNYKRKSNKFLEKDFRWVDINTCKFLLTFVYYICTLYLYSNCNLLYYI